jgi:hypothetical protein
MFGAEMPNLKKGHVKSPLLIVSPMRFDTLATVLKLVTIVSDKQQRDSKRRK